MDVQSIRDEFPALKQYTWFQNGGVSILPQTISDEYKRLNQELLDRGPMHIVYPDAEEPRRDATLCTLAEFFSVGRDEIAVMRGVSEAFQTVLRGLQWKAEDEVITTTDEEAALLLPLLHLRDLYNVRIVKLAPEPSPDASIDSLTRLISKKTKLIAVSHVTTDLGCRYPVAELCRIARENGVLSFVDVAHSAGLFPLNLREVECDFAGVLSYKWMYAPYASGLLYARKESQNRIATRYAGGRSEQALDFETDTYQLRETAERFQYGPWCWPLLHSWSKAAAWLASIGLNGIETRTLGLTSMLKEQLTTIDGVTLFTPDAANQSAALVSFGLEGWTGEQLAVALREEYQMITKPLPHSREGLRISIPFFTLETEIEALANALRKLQKKG